VFFCAKKTFLAFLATRQHGAAELRVGPDGRLPGRATVAEATAGETVNGKKKFKY